MKNLILITVLIVSFFAITGCENGVVSEDETIRVLSEANNDLGIASLDNSRISKISITCKGNCDGGGSCQVGTQLPPETMECTCSGCKMHIELTEEGSRMFKSESDALKRISQIETPKKSLKTFISKNYPSKIGNYSKVDYLFGKDFEAIVFNFTDDEGEKSVMYVNNLRNSKKFVIDCKGDCCCREIYDLNEGTASCSCDQCQMTVEELTEAPE